MVCVTFVLMWLPVGGRRVVMWVVSPLCWCGCWLVGGVVLRGLCHVCVNVAAGWWATGCYVGCVAFVLVWLLVSGWCGVTWVVSRLC